MSELTQIQKAGQEEKAGGMRLFAELVYHLGTHTTPNDKLDALIQ